MLNPPQEPSIEGFPYLSLAATLDSCRLWASFPDESMTDIPNAQRDGCFLGSTCCLVPLLRFSKRRHSPCPSIARPITWSREPLRTLGTIRVFFTFIAPIRIPNPPRSKQPSTRRSRLPVPLCFFLRARKHPLTSILITMRSCEGKTTVAITCRGFVESSPPCLLVDMSFVTPQSRRYSNTGSPPPVQAGHVLTGENDLASDVSRHGSFEV